VSTYDDESPAWLVLAIGLLVLLAIAPVVESHSARLSETSTPAPSGAPPIVSGPVASHPADREVPGGGAPLPTQDPGERLSALTGVHGDATWFCNADASRARLSRCTNGYPDGPGDDFYAAAGPDLRDGDWRGRLVTVERDGYSPIQVRLIDSCVCDSAVIDLYADAMWALGGTGRIEVTVSYGLIPLPQTDTEGVK
jgi:hypothetical protein